MSYWIYITLTQTSLSVFTRWMVATAPGGAGEKRYQAMFRLLYNFEKRKSKKKEQAKALIHF